MKILYCSAYYNEAVATGANVRFEELGTSLQKSADVTVLTPGHSPNWARNHQRLTLEKFGRLCLALEILGRFIAGKYDVLVTDLVPTIPWRGVYYVVHDLRQFTLYRRHDRPFSNMLYWFNLKIQKNVITVSNFTRSQIRELVGEHKRIIVSPNGVRKHCAVKKQLKDIDVLYIATFEDRKRHDILVRAISSLQCLGGHCNIQVLLLGRDLGTRGHVFSLIGRLGLNHVFKYVESGSYEEIQDIYQRSRVFCSPALYEGFGMPILEARVAGLHVVCSDIPVFREVGGEECHFFKPESVTDLASKLKEVLAKPAPSASLKKGLVDYYWDAIAVKLLDELGGQVE